MSPKERGTECAFPTPSPNHPPVPPPGVYQAVVCDVSLPKRRWGGRTVVRVQFQLNPPDGPVVVKWLNLRYGCPNSAIRRICALLIGSPTANFKALKGRHCVVEIAHMPGKKHPVFPLVTKVGLPDGSFWVPLGYGFSEERSGESSQRCSTPGGITQGFSAQAHSGPSPEGTQLEPVFPVSVKGP